MGGRLSAPRGPDGISQANRATSRGFKLNSRNIVAPLSAVLLAGIFFVYSRTTIQAAKVNAQRHREADGGSINWRNESLRRHGKLERPEERTLLGQLWAGSGELDKDKDKDKDGRMKDGEKAKVKRPQRPEDRNPIEDGIREARLRREREQSGN